MDGGRHLSSSPRVLAYHLGQLLGQGADQAGVLALHHDPQQGLGAGGAQQDAPAPAEFLLRRQDGALDGRQAHQVPALRQVAR